MAHANAEMVDTYFIIKFLLKMTEHPDIRSVLNDAYFSKIINLLQAKMNEEESKIKIQKYRSNNDLYKIANVFGS